MKNSNENEILRMLKCWVTAVDIIVQNPKYMTKKRWQVYQSIQQSQTYKQSVQAIQKASFKAICALLAFSLLFSSCSQSFRPITQKNHSYKGFTGKYRCNASINGRI